MVKKVFAVLAVLALGSNLFAAGVGTTGAQFLKIIPGAKPMGMGGAYGAVAGDLNSITYNPAGMAGAEEKEFSATYIQHFEGVSAGMIAGIFPLDSGVLGAGINSLSVAGIDRTETDETVSGTFGASDMMLTLAYAKKDLLLDGLCCGANLKIISEKLDTKPASAAAIDLACLLPLGDKFAVGLNLQNIGTTVKYVEEADPLPMNLKAAVSYKANDKLLAACDIDLGLTDQVTYVSLGGQFMLNELFALRAGYRLGYDTASLGSIVGLTLGVGMNTSKFGIDIAIVPFGDLGNAMRLSLGMKF